MLINRICGLVLPTSTKYLIDLVIGQRRLDWLWPIIGMVLAATVVQGATTYALTQSLSKAAQRLINELRARVQAHLARLPVSFYDHNNTGNLVSRVMSDVEGVRNLLGTGLVQFAGSIITAVIALGLLLRISVAMTVAAGALVALFTFTVRLSFRQMRPIFRERRKLRAEVTGRLTESIGGVRVVKGYHAEEREVAVFQRGLDKLLQNVYRTINATSAMDLSSKAVIGLVGAVVWTMGVHRVLAHTITLGDLVVFNLYLGMLVAPMMQIVSIGTQLAEAMAGLERTYELLQLPREDEDRLRQQTLGRIEGRVEFDEVSFAYAAAQGAGEEVLHDISFAATPGTMTALVGPSGAGKSTIIGLLAAFYSPTRGQVRVDGYDLQQVRLDGYRSQLGVVLQESFLFDGSIRDNVMFSRPAASAEEFQRACRTARVDEFAERFAQGYETVVGERGVKLSGGQRQRLSIARAILADPAILILDEATSSLDSESEALIQEGLQYLLRGRTTFVIAHRLSTIRAADQILVLEAGRIVERGRHAELLAQEGVYAALYRRQQGLEENLFLAPGEGGEAEAAPVPRTAGGEGDDPSPVDVLL
ncbi:MAG TPA: ABC transporter ATP-binding protein [Terriglobales bacterium]|nr:ABC transporter ATP-binding protein [Terriglobales bacterium]